MSKLWTEASPTADGIYVVWLMADEGEGHAPAEWPGVDRWQNGRWSHYGSAVVERSVKKFSNFEWATSEALTIEHE